MAYSDVTDGQHSADNSVQERAGSIAFLKLKDNHQWSAFTHQDSDTQWEGGNS